MEHTYKEELVNRKNIFLSFWPRRLLPQGTRSE